MSTSATSLQAAAAAPNGAVEQERNPSSMKWVAITFIAVSVLAACALAIAPEMGAFSASLVTQNAPLLLLVGAVVLGAGIFAMSYRRADATPAESATVVEGSTAFLDDLQAYFSGSRSRREVISAIKTALQEGRLDPNRTLSRREVLDRLGENALTQNLPESISPLELIGALGIRRRIEKRITLELLKGGASVEEASDERLSFYLDLCNTVLAQPSWKGLDENERSCLKEVIAYGFAKDKLIKIGRDEYSLLMRVLESENSECLTRLLEIKTVDLTERDQDGETFLHSAVREVTTVACVEQLLQLPTAQAALLISHKRDETPLEIVVSDSQSLKIREETESDGAFANIACFKLLVDRLGDGEQERALFDKVLGQAQKRDASWGNQEFTSYLKAKKPDWVVSA